jgi:hypothetical protein
MPDYTTFYIFGFFTAFFMLIGSKGYPLNITLFLFASAIFL